MKLPVQDGRWFYLGGFDKKSFKRWTTKLRSLLSTSQFTNLLNRF